METFLLDFSLKRERKKGIENQKRASTCLLNIPIGRSIPELGQLRQLSQEPRYAPLANRRQAPASGTNLEGS